MTERDELYLSGGAYALNALDEQERAEFERFLARSEELRTEVTGLSDTAVLLGLSSRPVTPSPELKSNIMALLDSTPQLGAQEPPASARSSRQAETAPVAGDAARPALQAVPSPADQQTIRGIASQSHRSSHRGTAKANARWFGRSVGLLATTAAVVALVVGGIVGGLLARIGDPDRLQELSQAADLETSVTDVDGGGTATLIWSDDQHRSAMLVDGLPTLSGDEVYQLWYIDDAGATSAGLLNASGARLQLLDGDREADDTVGMTVEPRGGSTSPTTDPIALIPSA